MELTPNTSSNVLDCANTVIAIEKGKKLKEKGFDLINLYPARMSHSWTVFYSTGNQTVWKSWDYP